MKKQLSKMLTVSLIAALLIASCSKSAVSGTDPVPALPGSDSSLIPVTDSSAEPDPIVQQRMAELISFPISSSKVASSIYLGGVITTENLANLSNLVITDVDNQYRNPVTIYTNAPIDSGAIMDIYPSRKNDQRLVSNMMKEGLAQYSSVIAVSPRPFNNRYNSLEGYFGENADVMKILDLGFKDTTRLDSTKGRLLMHSALITASLLLEPPIYKPFLQLKPEDEKWKSLFGSGAPQVISEIDYGLNFIIIFESSVGNARLTLALNRYLSHSQVEILSGSALSQLPDEDQTILKNTVSYGYMSGRTTPVSHKCIDALKDYMAAVSKIGQNNYLGEVISFGLNSLSDDRTYKSKFTVSDYPQKFKE